uniref:Uncharacterized protein n=1 Tax=viral metagenome TaxID=1070528 RepID=A0A6H1ZYZ1_9ZZZZ
MALTLSSTIGTLAIADLVATYFATTHGAGGLLYLQYTKGDEDGVRISISYGSKIHNRSIRYQHVSLNSSTRILTPTSYVLTASGYYRIPITWTCEEMNLTFTFAQYGVVTATGTVDVDFREAE